MLAVLVAGVALAAPPVVRVMGDTKAIVYETDFGLGAATISRLDGGRTGYYYDFGEKAGQLRPKAHQVVMLGLGGGEMLRAARRSLPKAELVGIDNDPAMIRVAKEQFHVDAFGVRCVEADAFAYVKQLRGVDVLIVDLFDRDVMPAKMLQRSFWADVRKALSPGGLVVVAVYPAHVVTEISKQLTLEGLGILDDPESHGTTVFFATPAAAPL